MPQKKAVRKTATTRSKPKTRTTAKAKPRKTISRTVTKSKPKTTTRKTTKSKSTSCKKSKKIDNNLISVQIKRHKDTQGNHHHIILDNIDNKHVLVGLTTKNKKGKNHPNYPLEKDPLNSSQQSYLRRQGTVDNKTNYYDERKGTMTKKRFL